jgi:hypothetical protein
MDDFIGRIGTFFYMIGIGLMLLFIASDAANKFNTKPTTDYNYLFFSVLLLSAGYLFRKRAAPPPAADRFKTLNKWRENAKKKKEEQAKAKQQKK